ncbi:PhzF family phenazine biosynthesis protein [Noviherbaspirillum massiliense]|uniref:PhzF family phenazine biosynthesis protein n=1 Tax=Noviherbaspirillum massiliense TaxID=1465823 RepID=UPI0002D2A451|nr:PhzF family phenazine biosynthesis protein [Noviherbaspirillum massiliense]
MARYAFRILNVFAESTFGGNALCVFEDARGMDDASMQALARQFNLSETTFILPSGQADARVRIFNPDAEMRFAGHPTLGSAQVVRDLLGKGDRVTLELQGGMVPVEANGDVWTLTMPPFSAPAMRHCQLTREAAARLLGLDVQDLEGEPVWVNTGAEHVLIPLAAADAVRRAAPRGDFLVQWPANGAGRKTAYLFAFEPGSNGGEVAARYFSAKPGGGINEDPGTGSACANLGAWLIETGRTLPQQLRISQGEAVSRPCRLFLEVAEGRNIRVGGRVIEIARGSVSI